MTEPVFTLHPGTTPVLLSLPHVGTVIPADQQARYVERALAVEDTDWHLERLYEFVRPRGVGMIVPRYSRYLIDLNRPPDDTPMYPGANNTELCPTRFFTGDPLYRPGCDPDAAEVVRRREAYWRPYHDALAVELSRLKQRHGFAMLYDGHSIRSELPWLFPGRLPDLNLGTADGCSCAGSLRAALAAVLAGQSRHTSVTDGRFKGGHITRHHGRPAEGVHAVQMEMVQRAYMNEAPPLEYDPARAADVLPVLSEVFDVLLTWRPDER
jgi:N-formylglutamate deformylase